MSYSFSSEKSERNFLNLKDFGYFSRIIIVEGIEKEIKSNTEDKTTSYGEDILVPYGLYTKTVYLMNHYTVLKYLEFYRKLYYTKHESLSDEEIWLASLTSKSFSVLNEMLSHILLKNEREKFVGNVIRMSQDNFNIHEWEKEKCDALVRAESRRVDFEEGME